MRSRAIVADLLAFVREERDWPLTLLEPAVVAGQATEALRPHLTLLGIELTTSFEGDGVWVKANAAALEQIVTNLLLNAAYAAGGGGHVSVRTRSTADQSLIVVEDDGAGLGSEALQHLFEPFFTTKPVGQGTGLGLFVALGNARHHGGDILAESPGERGARFTVQIPRASPPRPALPTPGSTPVAAVDGASVLIVDDEEAIRMSLTRYFRRRGWEVAEASDGREALAVIQGRRKPAFTMILCDLRMPGMGGGGFHAALKVGHPELLPRLVLVSGDVVSAEAAAVVRSTECRVLEKPFELKELGALADSLLAGGGGEEGQG
jgi:CheY-like chemotaxis protein